MPVDLQVNKMLSHNLKKFPRDDAMMLRADDRACAD
jgi:hypothetical protein